jgi:hypothetical protein
MARTKCVYSNEKEIILFEEDNIDDNFCDTMKNADFINNDCVYCGYHTENHDYTGYDKILHFITKKTLGNRNIKSLGLYEYELEVWPTDKYYKYCIVPNN